MARILVVDDDALVREMMRVMLEGSGHAVAEAGDGMAALDFLAAEPADLMIADIMMPELDGIGLIVAVRKRHPNLRVLCVSGGGRDFKADYLPIAEKLGADMVLAKPFKAKQLIAAVDAVLRDDSRRPQ